MFDPRRDVEDYLAEARRQGLRIRFALDSHGHNDYLSGLPEIAARTDARVLGSAEARLGYDHRPLRDGEQIELADVGIEVLHTPGFCATLQKRILPLPDHVEVFPTHVAGSLCGGSIGSRLSTTVGYERRTNPVLADIDSAQGFVEHRLRMTDLPAVAPYWERMREQNLAGVRPLGVPAEPPALDVERFRRAHGRGAVVLDVRPPEAFGGGHVPGALNVGAGSSFATWAGTVLATDAEILLVLDRPADLWPVTWYLLRIGYEPPAGWLAGGMAAWVAAAHGRRPPHVDAHSELTGPIRIGMRSPGTPPTRPRTPRYRSCGRARGYSAACSTALALGVALLGVGSHRAPSFLRSVPGLLRRTHAGHLGDYVA